MFLIAESGNGSHLSGLVHIEGRLNFPQGADYIYVTEGITNAQPSKAVNLAEGAVDEQVLVLVQHVNQYRIIACRCKFRISLIKEHEHIARNLIQEVKQFQLVVVNASRIVRAANEDHASLVVDYLQEFRKGCLLVAHTDTDKVGAVRKRRKLVDRERGRNADAIVALTDKGLTHHINDFIGAVTDHDLVGVHAVKISDGVDQLGGIAARIQVQGVRDFVVSFDRLRGSTERVLVRSEFNNFGQPVLRTDFFYGFARNVIRKFQKLWTRINHDILFFCA